MSVELHDAGAGGQLAVVPSSYADTLKATFDRSDELELAVRDENMLLARIPGSHRVLAQTFWHSCVTGISRCFTWASASRN
jgi:hypothetical protein